MNDELKLIAKKLEHDFPLAFRLAHPRAIQPPQGYCNPVYFATLMVADIICVQQPQMRQLSHMNGYISSMLLMQNQVPTYFVSHEFAEAVANTELPGDFKFAELKWPMDAQLFVLPDQFTLSYYGVYAPFLAVSKALKGDYPSAFSRKVHNQEFALPYHELPKDRIVFDYPVYHNFSTPTDYNGNYNLSDGVEHFKSGYWCDTTEYEAERHDLVPGLANSIRSRQDLLNGEAEQTFIQKALRLAVKLMLCVAARPGIIEHGHVTRPEKTDRKGRVERKAMWSPNVIGRTYKVPRKLTERAQAAGERAKPRFVFRRGHWTWQAKRLKGQEFVSVDQMPHKDDPNPDPQKVSKVGLIDFDTAGEELSNKFRACHERIWVEGFLFGDEITENEPLTPG